MVWNLVIEFRGNDEFWDRVSVAKGGGAHDTTQYLAHRNTNFHKMCTIMEHCSVLGHLFKPRKVVNPINRNSLVKDLSASFISSNFALTFGSCPDSICPEFYVNL